jgi:hypothetical protein
MNKAINYLKQYCLPILACGLLLCLLYPLTIQNVIQDDTWRHLALGRLFVETKSIPTNEPYAFWTNEKTFLDFSWLTCVLFYYIHSVFDLKALNIFAALTTIATLFITLHYERITLKASNLISALIAMSLAITCFRWRITPRPEILGYFFFAIIYSVLHSKHLSSRKKNLVTFITLLIWQNFHSTAFLGVIIVTIYNCLDKSITLKENVFFFVLTASTLFITPFGHELVYHSLIQSFISINAHILEFQPLDLHQWLYFRSEYLVFSFAYFLLENKHRNNFFVFDLLVIFILVAISIKHSRAIVYPILWLLPQAMRLVQHLMSYLRLRISITVALGLTIYVGLLSHLVLFNFGNDIVKSNLEMTADILISSPVKGNILNDFSIGGYLIYYGNNKYKIFIDNRSPIYTQTSFPAFINLFAPGVIENINTTFDIQAVLLRYPPKCAFLPGSNCGSKILNYFDRKRWSLIDWSSESLLYIKRSAKYENYINSRETRFLTPESSDPVASYNDLITQSGIFGVKLIKDEISRALSSHPFDEKALWYYEVINLIESQLESLTCR